MMSKKPVDRPQSAGDVAAKLKAWLADRGQVARRRHDRATRTGPRQRRRQRRVHAILAGRADAILGQGSDSGSSRTISVSDRDTKKLDEKGSGPQARRRNRPRAARRGRRAGRRQSPPGKEAASGSDKQDASTSDLATSSDIAQAGSKTARRAGSKSGSVRENRTGRCSKKSCTIRKWKQMKRKVAQRAQFNPLQPPNYVPPSRGSSWVLWVSIGVAAVVVVGVISACGDVRR